MIPEEIGEYDATPEAIIKVMDAHGVEKAVLLQGNYFGFQNLYTYEAIQKYPDRFTGAATYDPFCVQAEQVKAHLFDELNFKIVKFEVSNGSGLMSLPPAGSHGATAGNGIQPIARQYTAGRYAAKPASV